MSTPSLTVALPNQGDWCQGRWSALIEVARIAEELGVDRIVFSDHILMPEETHSYRWGKFPFPPSDPVLDPLALMAAVASTTTRIRIGTTILLAALRPAPTLAKTVATLDALSQGRVELGVATGWVVEDYQAQGLDFSRKGRLLEQTIRTCRALWGGQPVPLALDGRDVAVYCTPTPIQDRLPVLFGGPMSDVMARRIIELGDGWITGLRDSMDAVAAGASKLRAEAIRAGRSDLRVQAPVQLRGRWGNASIDETMRSVPGLQQLGVTDVLVQLSALCNDPADATKVLGDAVAAFRRYSLDTP